MSSYLSILLDLIYFSNLFCSFLVCGLEQPQWTNRFFIIHLKET